MGATRLSTSICTRLDGFRACPERCKDLFPSNTGLFRYHSRNREKHIVDSVSERQRRIVGRVKRYLAAKIL